MTTTTNTGDSSGNPITKYIKDFSVLKDNKGSYWAVQAVNILDCIAYYAMITTITLFLTGNVGLEDDISGYVVTGYGIAVSLTLVVAGFLTDSFGMRKATFIGIGLQTICRVGILVLGLSPEIPGREWMIVFLIILSAPGQAMMQAVFQAGTKLFSSKRSQSASYNVWYLLMNLGFAMGGLSVDVIRKSLELDLSYIYGMNAVTGILAILVGLAIVKKSEQGTDEADTDTNEKKASGWENFLNLFKQPAFKRMLALMGVLLGVRSVFLYTFMLMPLYWARTIEASSGELMDMGFVQSINPIMIFAGVFLFIPLANKWNMYKMLILGTLISTAAIWLLVMPWQWFGDSVASGYLWMTVWMMILLSLGEIIWSPKLYDYIATVAPKGQEGAYLGMGMIPWFLAKTIIGLLAGHMLMRWVPEGIHTSIEAGTLSFWESPEAMWLVLATWATLSVLVAWLFRGWFTKGTAAEVEEVPEAKPTTA